MVSQSKTIVWFRRDLRIEDNPALSMAAKDGLVLPVFIWCPAEEGPYYPGRCSRWWLKQSLAHLDQSLKSLGAPLLFIGAQSSVSALLQCIGATGATRVFYNHLYDPFSLVRDQLVKSQLVDQGIAVRSFNGDLLHEPWEIHDKSGHAFTTFNEFWVSCLSCPIKSTLFLPPWKLVPLSGIGSVESCSIDELGLEKESEKQSNELLSRGWIPGWSTADKLLSEFIIKNLLEYSNNRMTFEATTTSLLSPYLHFGEVSVRKIYQSVRLKQLQWTKEGNLDGVERVNFFLRSIGLREYSRYICFNFPFTHERSLLGNLKHYTWRADQGHFKSWRQGKTGYPLVDAGMRELWATGWIHNRTRVIVASFFVKFLLLPWTWGMKYFWDTLLDADLENDILGWQYISGSLPDGHALTRIDSPEEQGHRFDPDGEYIRNWIPELARMPTEWIHHPWDAPISVLNAAGVELGLNYPKPIIKIDKARALLDDAVNMMRELDMASRINCSSEVADNMVVKPFDVPTVVVRKEISVVTSSLDRRVPSFNNMQLKCHEMGFGELIRDTCLEVEFNICKEKESVEVNEDLKATAESTSKKRSISEAQFSVQDSCSFEPYGRAQCKYGSFKPECSIGSTSRQPVLNDPAQASKMNICWSKAILWIGDIAG